MARQVPLTQGQHALVDDDDYARVMQHKWFAAFDNSSRVFYAKRNVGKRMQTLASFVVNVPIGTLVDHINRDTLDNRRVNLRVVSKRVNNTNRNQKRTATTAHVGVSYLPKRQRWCATICYAPNKRIRRIFMTEAEALAQRKAWEQQYYAPLGAQSPVEE
jgi:hypothetical protein